MPVMLGGEKAWKQRVVGDVVLSYQWVNEEPAMVLFAKNPPIGAGAYIIGLSAIHKYVNSDGYPNVDYLIPQATEAARHIGLGTLAISVRNVADAILDGAEDLVRMPPEPQGLNEEKLREAIGKATIKVDGTTIYQDEVTVPESMQHGA